MHGRRDMRQNRREAWKYSTAEKTKNLAKSLSKLKGTGKTLLEILLNLNS